MTRRSKTRVPKLGDPLTPREKQVVELVATGMPNEEVGKKLLLSKNTVKIYVSKIFPKLGVSNRTELAVKVLKEEMRKEAMARVRQ